MRKPGREALIFGLLGVLVATTGTYVKLDADASVTARTDAAQAVHATDFQVQGLEPSSMAAVVILDNGTILHVRQCPRSDPKAAYESVDRMMAALETRARQQKGASQPNDNVRPRNESALPEPEETFDCRNFSATPADRALLARDYWAAYRDSKDQAFAGNVRGSLTIGLLGFPLGLGVWACYRFVRLRYSRMRAAVGNDAC